MLLRFFLVSKRSNGALFVKSNVSRVRMGTRNSATLPFRNEKNGLELKLTLDGEMLDGKMFFPVVRERLVERSVLLLGDFRGVSSPEGFSLVELLVLDGLLLDLLGLFLLVFLVLFILDFFDLRFVLLVLFDSLVVLDFL
jgi:hypothetical protein